MESLPAEQYQHDVNDRPPEWWILWKIIHGQVETIYRSYPGIDALSSLDDLVDYTTAELVKSKTTLGLEGATILWRMKTIARNRCKYYKKAQVKNTAKEAEAFKHYYGLLQEDIGEESEVAQKIQLLRSGDLFGLIEKICPPKQFAILVMHFAQGKKFVDIAREMRLNENTVRSEASRALKKILKSVTK